MILAFLDYETQSAEPKVTNPTEVGLTVLERQGKDFCLKRRLSQLIYEPSYPPQTEEIVELTGITDDMLKADGKPPAEVLAEVSRVIEACDYVFAHKVDFDRTVYESSCLRYGITPGQPKLGWICSLTEVDYPKKYKCKKLAHLCYDHGLISEPGRLHRAGYDTDLLAELITTKYDIDEIIKYWSTPWVYLRANVPPPWKDGGAGNKAAKERGFSYQVARGTDGPVFPQYWVKRVKESEIEAEKRAAVFPLTRVSVTTKETNENVAGNPGGVRADSAGPCPNGQASQSPDGIQGFSV